jgi:cytosine/adenosine deaminase-related metal-dependent hydrolase
MHVAESKEEVKLLNRKRSGLERLYHFAGWDKAWAPSADSPFAYLDRLGLLGPDLLAVHAVQARDRDIHLLSKSHTPVAHCPRSNKELGVGRMQLKKLLAAGVTVGLGTDSLASSPSLSMWDEMRYALRIHRRDGMTARDILELATMGGAKALGMGSEIGSLEPGKRADIIAVPFPQKSTGDIYSDLLRETNSCVMTMVNGKILHDDEHYSDSRRL